MLSAPVVAAVLAPLAAWRVYSRFKRLTSRQRSRTWRHRTTLFFFPLLLVLVGLATLGSPLGLGLLAAGVIGGSVLGSIALAKSTFEQADGEFYFTPHAYIGAVVALLFIGRMAWRAWEFYSSGGNMMMHDFVKNPLTLCIFGVLSGYYMTYAVGLLRWRKHTAPANN
jgi:hypothetical protein